MPAWSSAAAQSVIRDSDFAAETAELTRSQILTSASTNILAQANAALGSLDRIAQVIRLTGYVASTPQAGDQPAVINGASDLMVDVLGDAGRHTRAAVGVAALPAGCAVEIDAILQIKG